MLNVFLQLEHLKKETGTFPVLGGRHAQICGQKRLGGTTVYLFSEKIYKIIYYMIKWSILDDRS